MKNSMYITGLLSMLLLLFISCDNDDESNANQSLYGNYRGTFTVEYVNGFTFSNPVTVSFNEGNTYRSSGSEDNFPAGGNGTFEKNNSIIEFSDGNYWTANFDWNLILNGEYEYSLNGNELMIFANRTEFGVYRYELVRGD